MLLRPGRARVLPHLRDERRAGELLRQGEGAPQGGDVLLLPRGIVENEEGRAEGGKPHAVPVHGLAQGRGVHVLQGPELEGVKAALPHPGKDLFKGKAGEKSDGVERKAHGRVPPSLENLCAGSVLLR